VPLWRINTWYVTHFGLQTHESGGFFVRHLMRQHIVKKNAGGLRNKMTIQSALQIRNLYRFLALLSEFRHSEEPFVARKNLLAKIKLALTFDILDETNRSGRTLESY
jgi:hypothetical protein